MKGYLSNLFSRNGVGENQAYTTVREVERAGGPAKGHQPFIVTLNRVNLWITQLM